MPLQNDDNNENDDDDDDDDDVNDNDNSNDGHQSQQEEEEGDEGNVLKWLNWEVMGISTLKDECKARNIKTRVNSRKETLIKKLKEWEEQQQENE